MIRAAAVLIHLPSPRGFLGTGETSNVMLGEGGVALIIVSVDGPQVGEELFDMLRMLLRFREIREPVQSAVVWR
jgi:hypothetical protein